MTLECELKYLDVDLDKLSERLSMAGDTCQGRYFETNMVFDDADRSLKSAAILLRLRSKQGQSVLTVKHPPAIQKPSALKVYEEIETRVDDGDAMKKALEALGYRVAFSYEKVREKWAYMNCIVCLDRLPFGDFVELEGESQHVFACAKALGIHENETSKATYHALNLEYREKAGLPLDENFVFEHAARAAIVREFGKEYL